VPAYYAAVRLQLRNQNPNASGGFRLRPGATAYPLGRPAHPLKTEAYQYIGIFLLQGLEAVTGVSFCCGYEAELTVCS